MSMWPSAPGSGDILPWREAFLLLAIQPLSVLFSEMGLPPGMAEDPRALTAASREFLTLSKQNGGRPQWDAANQQWELDPTGRISSLIDETFQQLTSAYDADQSNVLRDWMKRHFVDSRLRENWWLWSLLFPSLVHETASRSRPSLVLQTATPTELRAAVAQRFGSNIAELDKQRLAEAQRVRLSEEEHALLQGEVTAPTDLPEWDAFALAQQVLESERAYRTWRDLQSRLDKNDRAAVLRWGLAEAHRRGMPTEHLAPPDAPIA